MLTSFKTRQQAAKILEILVVDGCKLDLLTSNEIQLLGGQSVMGRIVSRRLSRQ
jgi:hypothetical protein